MDDELSDDIKKKFVLPLSIELQDHKEKVFHNASVPLYVYFISKFLRILETVILNKKNWA